MKTILMFLLILSTGSFAKGPSSKSGKAHKRQHHAHQHGAGTLNMVLDKSVLQFEMKIPAKDIVGFEHTPRNKKQKEAVKRAKLKLKDNLFVLEGEAGCKLTSSNVEIALEHGEKAEHAEHHDEHDHHHGEKEEETHSDVEAVYVYQCQSPKKLRTVKVQLFDRFRGLKKLKVQMVTPKSQGSKMLTPKKSVITGVN